MVVAPLLPGTQAELTAAMGSAGAFLMTPPIIGCRRRTSSSPSAESWPMRRQLASNTWCSADSKTFSAHGRHKVGAALYRQGAG